MSTGSEMTRTPKRIIVSVSVRKFNSGMHFAVNHVLKANGLALQTISEIWKANCHPGAKATIV